VQISHKAGGYKVIRREGVESHKAGGQSHRVGGQSHKVGGVQKS